MHELGRFKSFAFLFFPLCVEVKATLPHLALESGNGHSIFFLSLFLIRHGSGSDLPFPNLGQHHE